MTNRADYSYPEMAREVRGWKKLVRINSLPRESNLTIDAIMPSKD